MRGFNLSEAIERFFNNKTEADKYKKECDKDNKAIKDYFNDNGLDNFETNGLVCKMTTQDRSKLNEEALIYKNECGMLAEDLEAMGIIQTKKFIDVDKLEDAVYRGDLSQSTLDQINLCWDIKEVQILKVTKKKEVK